MIVFGLRVGSLRRNSGLLPTTYHTSLAEAKTAFEQAMPAARVRATITESDGVASVRIASEGRSDGSAVEWTEREKARD